MGVSTDAKLVYGFEIEPESDESEICDLLMDEEYDKLEAAEKLGGELVYHCSDEETMYIVGVDSTSVTAHRGYPKTIDPAMFSADPTMLDATLRKFAEAIGVEPKTGKWLICSYWG